MERCDDKRGAGAIHQNHSQYKKKNNERTNER